MQLNRYIWAYAFLSLFSMAMAVDYPATGNSIHYLYRDDTRSSQEKEKKRENNSVTKEIVTSLESS